MKINYLKRVIIYTKYFQTIIQNSCFKTQFFSKSKVNYLKSINYWKGINYYKIKYKLFKNL